MKAPSNESIEQAAEQLGVLLTHCGWRVSCAESCTGGGIAQAITAIAGSSGWFDLGLVTYSNAMKQALLGVAAGTLEQHGAVSEPVVREMAAGALVKSGADIAVSTSGIAGPGGGSDLKPVGMVCFAWGTRQSMSTATQQFSGTRAEVRLAAVHFALQQLLDYVSGESV